MLLPSSPPSNIEIKEENITSKPPPSYDTSIAQHDEQGNTPVTSSPQSHLSSTQP